jgi:hypothetical protein
MDELVYGACTVTEFKTCGTHSYHCSLSVKLHLIIWMLQFRSGCKQNQNLCSKETPSVLAPESNLKCTSLASTRAGTHITMQNVRQMYFLFCNITKKLFNINKLHDFIVFIQSP